MLRLGPHSYARNFTQFSTQSCQLYTSESDFILNSLKLFFEVDCTSLISCKMNNSKMLNSAWNISSLEYVMYLTPKLCVLPTKCKYICLAMWSLSNLYDISGQGRKVTGLYMVKFTKLQIQRSFNILNAEGDTNERTVQNVFSSFYRTWKYAQRIQGSGLQIMVRELVARGT